MAQNWWDQDETIAAPSQPGLGRPVIQRHPQAPPRAPEQVRSDVVSSDRTAALTPLEVRKAAADAIKAELDARDAASASQARIPPELKVVQQQLQTDHVLREIGRAHQELDKGYAAGNTWGSGVFQKVPILGQHSANLAATLSGLKGGVINDTVMALKAQSATGASGYGSLSEQEADRLAAAVAALYQTQDPPALKNALGELDLHYRSALALLNKEDPRKPTVARKYGINLPETADFNRRVAGMIDSGADLQTVRQEYLKSGRPFPAESARHILNAIKRRQGNAPKGWTIQVEGE